MDMLACKYACKYGHPNTWKKGGVKVLTNDVK